MPNRLPKPSKSSQDARDFSAAFEKFSPEKFQEDVMAAVEAGDYERVMELFDSAPQWMKNQVEFSLFRASVLISLGDLDGALRLLLVLERKNPSMLEIQGLLALLYMDLEYPAHALQAARRGLAARNLGVEELDNLNQLIPAATAILQQQADQFGVALQTMQQAAIFNEKSIMALDELKYGDVDYFAQKAVKMIPTWTQPQNNRARALYFSGRTEEAIQIVEANLANNTDPAYALHLLTVFYYGLDQVDRARSCTAKLVDLFPQVPKDGMPAEYIITSLALVEDTPELVKIAGKYLNLPSNTLFSRSWYCLAVAMSRNGNWKNALKLMRKAAEEDDLPPVGEKFLDELTHSNRKRKSRLTGTLPEYPGADLLMNEKVIIDLDNLFRNTKNLKEPVRQQKVKNYLQKYPFVSVGFKRILWNSTLDSNGAEVLVKLNQPELDDEILRFAHSQSGSQRARLGALMALAQAGRYSGPKQIKLWNEELEEWREVSLNTQQVGPVPNKTRPKTIALIEKAHRAKRPEDAIALLRRAVDLEPDNPMVLFNLGVVLATNGNDEEGEALIQQAVTIDPGYTFGQASIALVEAERGNVKAAMDRLDMVMQADVIAPDTAAIANMAWSLLALERGDKDQAREHYDAAVTMYPDHPMLNRVKELLDHAEKFSFFLDYQRDSAIRSHQKELGNALTPDIGLRACLETRTKDMLGGSAKSLGVSTAGKKEDVISRIKVKLLDVDVLREILKEDLSEDERECLKWLLEAGGLRPWKELTRKYGDDMYESTYWVFNTPNSIPGRLKCYGLLFSGSIEDQQVALIPADLRQVLQAAFDEK